MSAERVRQIEKCVLEKLRVAAHAPLPRPRGGRAPAGLREGAPPLPVRKRKPEVRTRQAQPQGL
jgi:hypothetical protein